jgi:diguanylate cyclase (GGDEF)-like protein
MAIVDQQAPRAMRILVATQADQTGGSLARIMAMVDPAEFDIEYSESLECAFAMIAEDYFDAMVLSLELPEGEGREAIERAVPVLGQLPVVAISPAYDPEIVAAAIRSGIQRVISRDTLTESSLRDALLHAAELHSLWGEASAARRKERYLAYHDPTTGLPNRQWLTEHLPRLLARARSSEQHVAVVFMDLDGFKRINDSRGHGFGDIVLIEVAQRLRALMRRSDVVVRLGGDEFLLVLTDTTPNGVEIFADSVLREFAKPLLVENRQEWVTSSLGIAMAPEDGHTPEELLSNADAAMYQAKTLGKNRFCRSRSELSESARNEYGIVRGLHQALERDELRLFVQPQVDVVTGELIGAEALVRWQHPESGLLAPGSFLPAAARSGLMPQIDDWVLGEACARLRGWMDRGLELQVAVNVSPQQLADSTAVRRIADRLSHSGVPARRLELEITESSVLTGAAEVQATLREISALGVRIALDDFGTGYSSLAVFWQTPLQRVKIDQSFVASCADDDTAGAIILSTLHLAATKGIDVTAEGVETLEQAEMLHEFGCRQMQGYFFGKPMEAGDFDRWLSSSESSWVQALDAGSWCWLE